MKINILGLGRVFNHYKNILEDNNQITIGLLYDKNKSKRDAQCEDFQVAQSYEDFVKDKCDLICVLTPSGTHYELVKDLLERGKNVLVEKPMALLPIECKKLKELALEYNVKLYCGFQNRFNRAILKAKDAINENSVGKIISCHIALEWCRYQDYYNDEWHGRWELDGGVIAQQAIHHIDATIFLLGKIKQVVGKGSNIINQLEAEDTFTGLMEFENGALATLSASTSFRPRDKEARITINGTEGSISIYGIAINKATINTVNTRETVEENFTSGYGLSHLPMMLAILKDLEGSNLNEDQLSIDNTIHTTEVISALYYSSESGQWGICGKNVSSRWGEKN